jgi:hypothetical protein
VGRQGGIELDCQVMGELVYDEPKQVWFIHVSSGRCVPLNRFNSNNLTQVITPESLIM